MSKTELLENYTMEQLADMVIALKIRINEMENTAKTIKKWNKKSRRPIINKLTDKVHMLEDENKKLKNASEVKDDEIHKLKRRISNLEESNGRLQAKVDTYNNYLLPRCTKEAKEMIDHNDFVGVKIVAAEQRKKCESGKEDEIKSLKEQIQCKEAVINQIDTVLRELFGVTFEICETREDFDGFKKCLEKHIKTAAILDLLPTEPIKVADMLINAEGQYERNIIEKAIYGNDKGAYNLFSASELRQIAEHLIMYCNSNKES